MNKLEFLFKIIFHKEHYTCIRCGKVMTLSKKLDKPIIDTKIGQIIGYDKTKKIRLPQCNVCKVVYL